MKIEKFEDLEVWQEGVRLSIEIYKRLRDCRDYGLRDQIQRASISIPSNIAEGYDRQTNKKFIQFLFIARGSCAELRTQIYIAIKLEIINREEGSKFINDTKKISAMLYNLIRTRKEKFK